MLVSAYACRPLEGSEPGIAWNVVERLSRNHELTVLTRARHRHAVEDYLHTAPLPNVEFVFHDLPRLARLKPLPGGFFVYYYAWQITAGRVAVRLARNQAFDLAYHLTLGSIRFPVGIWRAALPQVVGPVGGGEEAPVRLWISGGLKGALLEGARWLSNRIAAWDPLIRKSFGASTLVLATTHATAARVERVKGSAQTLTVPQVGIEPDVIDDGAAGRTIRADPVRFLYVGRLLAWKGVHLAIEAFRSARSTIDDIELHIIGSGPFENRLNRQVEANPEGIHLHGPLPRPTLLRMYKDHDVFVFPSLHDSGGIALLEAMANEIPPICLDIGGPGEIVQEGSGVLIPATSTQQVIEGMATAMTRMAADASWRLEMGRSARERATEFSWDARVIQLEQQLVAAAETARRSQPST